MSSLHYTYLGSERYSYVPDGLSSRVASTPGSLCSTCATLDVSSLLVSPAGEEIAPSMLGTLQEVSRRSKECDFCYLVITALRTADPKALPRDGRKWLPRQCTSTTYVSAERAGTYFDAENRRHDVYCIRVAVHGETNDDVATSNSSCALIRLLANDAHILNQRPMYHGRLSMQQYGLIFLYADIVTVGNHLSPSLLYQWIETCKKHHPVCSKVNYRYQWEQLIGPRALRLIDTSKMCISKVGSKLLCLT